jgi:pimeloyl-ACP methyl ester carboxylesterase
MPNLERDGLELRYWIDGRGYPLMLFAPGGMNSIARMWRESPAAPGQPMPWIDPTAVLADDFRVISMDQRNAGGSSGPVSGDDGWHTYTADHLALLDELGIGSTHVMGGCIGSSYALALCQAAPGRVSAAVLQNPIGLTPENRALFLDMFDRWADERATHLDPAARDRFKTRMFGGDFVFSVDREFVRTCPVPLLVLAGNDEFHPTAVAEEIASLAPHAELVLEWAGPDRKAATATRVRQFLLAHTPTPS